MSKYARGRRRAITLIKKNFSVGGKVFVSVRQFLSRELFETRAWGKMAYLNFFSPLRGGRGCAWCVIVWSGVGGCKVSALAVALKLARSSRFWCGGGIITQRPKKWRVIGGCDSLALFSGSKLLFSGDGRTIIFFGGRKKNSPAVVQG